MLEMVLQYGSCLHCISMEGTTRVHCMVVLHDDCVKLSIVGRIERSEGAAGKVDD